MNSGNFVHKNHGVGLNQYHLQWCTKYRYKCTKRGDIAAEMENILKEIANGHGILIHDMVIGPDHVHLFVSIPMEMSVSKALQLLKGGSSYCIFKKYWRFRIRYPNGHFWSPGHFSRSISNVTSAAIKGYIEKHDFAKLNETIESVDDEVRQLKLCEF